MRPLPTTGKPVASGSYYQPVSDGHGLFVFVKGEDVCIYWYTGNTDNDYPRWHMAYGKQADELELFTTRDGTIQDPTTAVEVLIGRCRISEGLFTWMIGDARGGIELTQIVKATGGGVFYDPARKGEGACVLFYDDMETGEPACVVFLFTYGQKDILAKESTQRWYAGVGSLDSDQNAYALGFYQTRGKFQTAALDTTFCGRGSLIVADENTISLHFKLDGRNETYTMTRLV